MEKRVKKAQNIKKFIPLYLMLLPALVYLFINNYIPMAGIVVAFKNYSAKKGIWGSPWCGLKNFEYLFKNDAKILIRNTLLYNIVFIILGIVLGVALAIMITDVVSSKLKKLYQSSILLPYLLSMVIVSYIVYGFLSAENGLINNSILKLFGQEGILWYSEKKYWPFILTFVHCWKAIGYGTLLYIAAITGIDPSFYESARLDGAGKWKQIKYITLPCITPTIITLTLLNIGKIFYSDFGLFYQVPQDSGALYSVTSTIDTYVYRAMISAGGIGRSSAAGVFQSVVGFILVVSANFIVRKKSKDNALF